MARATKIVVIEDEGRDRGKQFLVTEMDAVSGEKWAMRLFTAMMAAGVQIPADVAKAGIAGIAAMGLQAVFRGIPWSVAEPLLDDLLRRVQFIPDPMRPDYLRPIGQGGSDDVEEVLTWLTLRIESFKLNTSFLKAVASWISRYAPAKAVPGNSISPTSPNPSP